LQQTILLLKNTMNLRTAGNAPDDQVLQPLDLSRQETSTPQFRMLQSIHEAFARSLSNVLSAFLQSEIQATLDGTRLTTAGDFRKTLPNPSCLIVLRLHPGPETMTLYLESATVLTLLDLLLGGSGSPGSAPRELTEIEWSLLEEISRVIVRALGESWQVVKPVEFVVESMGSDPSMVACPDPARSVLRVSFDMQFAGQTGHFEIVVPVSFFAAVGPAPIPQEIAEDVASKVEIERNARLLEDAEVELEVHLEGPHLSFGDFLALQQGQVVKFDHALHAPVRAVVNGDPSLTGHILGAGRKRAFQVGEMFSA
jgi:flagellar motor switch protein FliM